MAKSKDVLGRVVANKQNVFTASTPKPALATPPAFPTDNAGNPNVGYQQTPRIPAEAAAPTPSGGGGGGGGGNGGDSGSGSGAAPGPDPLAFANDWYKAFFQSYGLPANVQSEIIRILTSYASDPATAQALAQQYLRTTDWYQQTFPGFTAGQRNGLFTDETGYRGYLNQVNQIFNQYLGRHVTSDELAGYLGSGYAPSYVGSLLQGQAWANANGNDIRQLTGGFGDNGIVSDADLATLGNEHAGIDTSRGQSLDAMVSRAQQKLSTIFQGKLGTPASLSLGPSGLAAPSGLGGNQTPDVGA